jgi:peptidoglycan DL-endopeptidase RipA
VTRRRGSEPRRRASRLLPPILAALLLAPALAQGVGHATPAPPPPPSPAPAPPAAGPGNPSDDQLSRSRQGVDAAAAQVGALTGQLADAQAAADQLGDQLEVRRELANKAMVDLGQAQAAAARAARAAAAARADTSTAAAALESARQRADQFVAAAYEQGPTGGSLGLLAQASDPSDLVGRAQLTDALARQQAAALDAVRRAQVVKANADSLARAAQLRAEQRRAAAQGAQATADDALRQARAAVTASVARLQAVDARRAAIEHRLDVLTAADTALRGQRQRYLGYQRELADQARRLAQQATARLAARATTTASRTVHPATPPTGGTAVQSVIDRALSEVGVTYAWGGGNADGATLGVRDGGEADSFGDYAKTGFDCSGLMVYAFGAMGIGLPHYSGYQYDHGHKVPVSQMQPGDLLFWAEGGTIHHVALYIGNGRMVEAPYSGGTVRVTPVRYGDGLMPDAVRLL